MSERTFYQCRLERLVSPDNLLVTTGWIEGRGAKVGAFVEMPPGTKELWKVAEAFLDNGVPENVLKKRQIMNRGSLPSVEKMPGEMNKVLGK